MNLTMLLEFLFYWLPGLLLFVFVFFGTYKGLRRGFRKSSILFMHSLILFIIFVILYLVVVETTFGDRLILDVANIFFGGSGGLQNYLGVSTDLYLFRDVVTAYLEKYIDEQGSIQGVAAVLEGNKAYIQVLVNYIYHIVFVAVYYVLYLILDFILYLFYSIFNSDRRYARKQNKKFKEGKEYTTYHKNRIGGALIGFTRGLIAGVFMLSCVGGTLYMLSGDTGTGTLIDYNFSSAANTESEENTEKTSYSLLDETVDSSATAAQTAGDTVNQIYEIYQYLDGYAKKGIFKYLNAAVDEEDGPVYLIFVDALNKGTVTETDEATGETKTYSVQLRKEISNYTLLAKNLINLMLESSDEKDVQGLFDGTISSSDFVAIVESKVLNDPDFQSKLLLVVSDFPEDSYLGNFVMSIMDSAVEMVDYALDNMVDADDAIKAQISEPIKILFKKGYYSEMIPEEKELKESGSTEVLPYINISSLINKEDIITILECALSYLPKIIAYNNQGGFTMNDYVDMVTTTVGYVKQLSLFKDASKVKNNGAISRLYYYADAAYLESDSIYQIELDLSSLTGTTSDDSAEAQAKKLSTYETYLNKLEMNIDWIGELEKLVDCVDDCFNVYANVYDMSLEKTNAGETLSYADLLDLFDPSTKYYESTHEAIENVCGLLYDSTVLGSVLKTGFVTDVIATLLKSVAGENYTYPTDITYTNEYDSEGNLVKEGELYNLYKGIEIVLSPDSISDVRAILDTENENHPDSTDDWIGIIHDYVNIKDANGEYILDYICNSKLLMSVMSEVLISTSENNADSIFYISDKAKETDAEGNPTRLLKTSEIKDAVDTIPVFINYVYDMLPLYKTDEEGNQSLDMDKVLSVVECDGFETLAKNELVQGVIGKLFSTTVRSYLESGTIAQYVKYPESLNDPENWVDSYNSELIYLVNSLRKIVSGINISFDDLSSSYKSLLARIIKFAEDGTLNEVLNSKIIHYTLSNVLDTYDLNGDAEETTFELIIPYSSSVTLLDDSIDRLIKKDELVTLLNDALLLNIVSVETDEETGEDVIVNGLSDYNSIIQNVIMNKEILFESNIISATLAKTICNVLKSSSLTVPDRLIEAAKYDNIMNYSSSNEWYSEIRYLFDAFDEIFEITVGARNTEGFSLSFDTQKIYSLLTEYSEPSYVNESYSRLELLLRSSVISATFTKMFDTTLTSDIIDTKVRDKSKNDGVYTYDEISGLLDFAMLYLDADSLDLNNFSLSDFNIDDGIKINEDFNDSYRKFYLVRGIITKVIESQDIILPYYNEEEGTHIYAHPKAYENYNTLKVLKKSEINTLISIINKMGNSLTDFDLTSFTFKDFLDYIGTDDSSCSSYLLDSTISHYIMYSIKLSGKNFTIPKSTTAQYQYTYTNDKGNEEIGYYYIIKPSETAKIVGIFDKLGIDSIDNINLSTMSATELYYFQSDVVNATLCDNVLFNGSFSKVKYLNIKVEDDIHGEKCVILTSSEYTALVDALKIMGMGGGTSFSFDMDSLSSDKLDTIMDSSVLQIAVTEYIDKYTVTITDEDSVDYDVPIFGTQHLKVKYVIDNFINTSADEDDHVNYTVDDDGNYVIGLMEFYNKIYRKYIDDTAPLINKTMVSGGIYDVTARSKSSDSKVYSKEDVESLVEISKSFS